MKKILFVIILLSIFLFQCKLDEGFSKVNVPDKNLKRAFLIALGEFKYIDMENMKVEDVLNSPQYIKNKECMKRNIFSNELENIKELRIISDSFSMTEESRTFDLSGIEFCPNLEKLELVLINQIDISKLFSLTKIKELRIEACKNIDLSSISKLKSIENLTIFSYNKKKDSSDLCFLTNLKNLTELDISFSPNLVKDLTPLLEIKEKTKLSKVSLNRNSSDLLSGTPNCEVVDKLIEAGVSVE